MIKPKRQQIDDAIKSVEVRTEDMTDDIGTMFTVGDMRALAEAAKWALVFVDHGASLPTKEHVGFSAFKRRAAKRKEDGHEGAHQGR